MIFVYKTTNNNQFLVLKKRTDFKKKSGRGYASSVAFTWYAKSEELFKTIPSGRNQGILKDLLGNMIKVSGEAIRDNKDDGKMKGIYAGVFLNKESTSIDVGLIKTKRYLTERWGTGSNDHLGAAKEYFYSGNSKTNCAKALVEFSGFVDNKNTIIVLFMDKWKDKGEYTVIEGKKNCEKPEELEQSLWKTEIKKLCEKYDNENVIN